MNKQQFENCTNEITEIMRKYNLQLIVGVMKEHDKEKVDVICHYDLEDRQAAEYANMLFSIFSTYAKKKKFPKDRYGKSINWSDNKTN